DVLAKKMRMAGDAPPARVANLLDAFKRRTHDVHELFSNLFVDVADQESARRTLREGMARRVLETRFSPALMKEFRFHDPDRAHRFLKTLRDGPPTAPASEKSVSLFFEVLPSILELCAQAPDPNGAVENLVRFIEASQAREMFLRLFSENGKVLELLLNLFGSGEVLPSILIKQPNLMDVLMNAESLYRFKTSMQMEQEAETLLADCAGKEGHAVPLRRFKQAEELRIGVRYLIRETGLVETMADLSALAELYLKLALRFATEDVLREKAFACGLDRFAIIAMGKLGGKELNFGSDLDLIFVYEEEEGHGDLVSGYSAISRKVVQYCSVMTPAGYAYKVDTDLRPEGSRGMLVLSLQGFTDYFKTRGRIWEQQAMTRARWVAGNQDLGERFLQVAHAFAYRPKLDYGSLIEIARLRERMEKELAQEAQKGKNVKLGAGGIADIEFTVQILQLMQGKRYPQLRQTNTLEVLSRAAQLSLMDGSEARQLSESYLFLRNLECALRLRSERMGNHLPVDGEMLAALARMVGYREDGAKALGDALMRDYERVTVLVRALFRKTVDVHLRMAQ
ncbi:MAG: hypothetical protein ACE5ER_11945, partial [Nitrospinaceae bacterium]